ncbi:MAG: response regulator, partial [Deltaproteobacteria bacterium]
GNPACYRMFGFDSEEEFKHFSVADFYVNPEERKAFSDNLLAKGSVDAVELQLKKKDGTPFWGSVSARVVYDESEKNPYFDCTIMDITARKQAEEEKERLQAQLSQAQKVEAIGTLAGGIAHNFNNLLMGIVGNTSLMLLETNSSHPNYERLKNIQTSVQNGSKLTHQLLGYAREGRCEIRPISLNQLVKETSDTLAMTKREIRVHQELSKDLFGIKADQGQIEQILLNLYVNAADAMPGGGNLFLKTMNVTHEDMKGKHYKARHGDYVLLTVRDTGIGMDKKTQERVFDPFFTTKGLAKGTGLGLASVYGIIKAHGGYIDVESKKDHGTTFEIYLPASSEKEVIEEKQLPEKILKGKETVLLVDDEDIVIDVGEEILKTLGYKVFSVRSGKEAIELYKENREKIDMVLLDMVMPDMGGGETYDRMKEINPDIKVLLLSGYSIDGQATEILRRGCDGFIQKPFDMQGLSQRIRKILNKK